MVSGRYSSDNFDEKRAYHAMQAAQQEMQDSQDKMLELQRKVSEIHNEVESMQAQYDKIKEVLDEEWNGFIATIDMLKSQVREKIDAINECNKQEEYFKNLAESEQTPNELKPVYVEAERFFSKLAIKLMMERDDLINKKRQQVAPDNSKADELLTRLKSLRKDKNEILEDYHAAKNDFSLKKTNFERAKAKYDALKNPEITQDSNAYSSRPQRMELDESLLIQAEIPNKYWDNCEMECRADGKIDIYYGGDENTRHGHVVLSHGNVEYSRKPELQSRNAV